MAKKDPIASPAKKCVVPEYSLRQAPQVEPDSSYWGECPQLRMVRLDELRAITDDPGNPGFFPPYPDPCTPGGKKIIEREMEELLELSRERDDPCKLVNDTGGCPALSSTPCEYVKKLPEAFGCRAPISKLLSLTPPAIGEAVANRLPGQQIIRTGRGMARAVEAETPGLYHRHALNYLITRRSWSPPRQALVWAALDIAIASALQAAWYYKWRGVRAQNPTARRERPIEYALRHHIPLHVLFDLPDELNPNYILCPDARPFCGKPKPVSPGTPRHPAYPSGHSTYSGAASTVLAFFFENDPIPDFLRGGGPATTAGQELRNMADNIGMGRLWAGIHWRSDHEAGLKLGQVVACLVLQQLANICGGDFTLCPPQPNMVKNQCDCRETMKCADEPPPPVAKLEEKARRCREQCTPCDKPLPHRPLECGMPRALQDASPETADLRSVQQGGGN